MIWKKKNPQFSSLKEIVENNTKLPLHEFLNPPQNPYLKNLDEAVALTRECIEKKLPIKIIGDYDADGVNASAILDMALTEAAGYNVEVRLPRRFSEGYGLSMKIIDETDSGLIITVDNGIAAIDQVKKAKEKGLTVIIIDHHLPVTDKETGNVILPEADVIIDPHAVAGSEFHDYCGAGLAYRFAKELVPQSKLLNAMLVMASIATVADVMPLVGDNRNLVIGGLRAINKRQITLGMDVLLRKLNMEYINEGDYGFKLGPIINASGRLFDDGPMDVEQLLKTHRTPQDTDFQEVLWSLDRQADELIKRNEMRKEIVRNSMAVAYDIIEKHDLMNKRPLIIYDPSFSEGIIGIIAGHLAEELRTPCLVFTDSKESGILKGSGRTYGDVHLKELLDTVSDLLCKYGGHAGAAGMSAPADKLGELQKRMEKNLLDTGIDLDKDKDSIYYDLEIPSRDAAKTIMELNMYAPYGEGNQCPVFKIDGFECTPVDGKFGVAMGKHKNHAKFRSITIEAVGFDMYERYVKEDEPKVMDFIGNLSQNYFNKEFRNQIDIIDFKNAENKNKTDLYQSLASALVFI